MDKNPYVYMLANEQNGTIYVGVTSNLIKRVYEHKNDLVQGFTKKYQVHNLVWFELHNDIGAAILREKQIKAGSRQKKISLIEGVNPTWKDLYQDILQ
jgi:putative endonuclease